MDEMNQKNQVEGQTSTDVNADYDEYNLANFKFFGQKEDTAPSKNQKTEKSKKTVNPTPSAPDITDDYNIDSLHLDKAMEEEIQKPKAKKSQKPKKERTPKQIRRRRIIARILLSVFLIGVISCCTIVGGVAVYIMNFMDHSIPADLDALKLNLTSVVYIKDSSGKYVEYQRIHGVENRIWISLDKIPTLLQNAFIAIEDENFETHHGVDWKRTIGAIGNEIFGYWDSRQGGSTITQQLVKNLTGDDRQDAARKIREIFRALELEKIYSKDTILECYLNTIPLGGSCYGVEVASEYYFGKKVDDLTIAEAAIIAGITKSPRNNRPDTNFENSWARAKTVLAKMLELGFISQEEYDAALVEEITVVADKNVIKEVEVNSYFVDTLITQVAEDLCEKYGYEKSEALNKIYNGGYKIYSSLDPNLQAILEKNANDPKYATVVSKVDGVTLAQVGLCITDYSGHILATVGGRGEKTGNMLLDRSYGIAQQPGSGIKPLGAYAPAVEQNLITYSTIMQDEPLTELEPGRLWPINFYKGYTASNTIAHAVARSINTIPCKLVQQLNPSKAFEFVTQKLGLKHLNPGVDADETISALAIGGTNGGVTPVELCAAYAVFGNGGKYYSPKTYSLVTDQKDNTVLETDSKNYTQAISEDTAGVMNGLLQNAVYGKDGTCWMLQGYHSGGMKAFGKSGTSTDYLDNWLVAGSPYYVATIWYGFDVKESCDGTYDHKYMLANIFKEIHKGLPSRAFALGEGVVEKKYCAHTGLLATEDCPRTLVGFYKTNYLPDVCPGIHDGPPVDDINNVNDGTGNDKEDTSSNDSSSKDTSSNKKPKPDSTSSDTSSEDETVTSRPPSIDQDTSSEGSTSSNNPSSDNEPVSSEESSSEEPVSSEESSSGQPANADEDLSSDDDTSIDDESDDDSDSNDDE
ncbi:MAG: penicillin-binding protein [Clostridia bacterium]|nr:penicillin-binding protein [Clostridia bacterium]